jgi:hypothetical protein
VPLPTATVPTTNVATDPAPPVTGGSVIAASPTPVVTVAAPVQKAANPNARSKSKSTRTSTSTSAPKSGGDDGIPNSRD